MGILDLLRTREKPEQRGDDGTAQSKESRAVMSPSMVSSELERDVLSWRDRYVSRVDREMITAFPMLEKALLTALEQNLKLVLLNRPKQFSEKVVQPTIESWIKRTITPILNDAGRDLTGIAFQYEQLFSEDFDVSRLLLLLLPAGMTVAGLGLVVAGFLAGITTTTFLIFWSSASVTWPLLVAAAAVGTALVVTGAIQLSHVRNRVAKTFVKHFMPKVRECLIGEGYTIDKQHHDSVRVQLESAIARTAQEVLVARRS